MTQKIYLNGELIGSGTTSKGSSLTLGGSIFMGRNPSTAAEHWIFGGQLFKLNLFSERLNSTAINKMATSGLCSTEEEKYPNSRLLKWEDILQLPRNGAVSEVDSGCPSREQLVERIDKSNEKLNRLEDKIDKIIVLLDESGEKQAQSAGAIGFTKGMEIGLAFFYVLLLLTI